MKFDQCEGLESFRQAVFLDIPRFHEPGQYSIRWPPKSSFLPVVFGVSFAFLKGESEGVGGKDEGLEAFLTSDWGSSEDTPNTTGSAENFTQFLSVVTFEAVRHVRRFPMNIAQILSFLTLLKKFKPSNTLAEDALNILESETLLAAGACGAVVSALLSEAQEQSRRLDARAELLAIEMEKIMCEEVKSSWSDFGLADESSFLSAQAALRSCHALLLAGEKQLQWVGITRKHPIFVRALSPALERMLTNINLLTVLAVTASPRAFSAVLLLEQALAASPLWDAEEVADLIAIQTRGPVFEPSLTRALSRSVCLRMLLKAPVDQVGDLAGSLEGLTASQVKLLLRLNPHCARDNNLISELAKLVC